MDRSSEIEDVKGEASLMVKSEDVAEPQAESTRDLLKQMIVEAEEHGISQAEVIRAMLAPIFAPQPKGCDCYSCVARRKGNPDFESDFDEERV